MAEDARRWNGAVVNLFDVRGADAAGRNAHEQFVFADARDGHGFGAEIVRAAVNGSAHGFGNRKHGNILTTDGQGWTRIFGGKGFYTNFTKGHEFFKDTRRDDLNHEMDTDL